MPITSATRDGDQGRRIERQEDHRGQLRQESAEEADQAAGADGAHLDDLGVGHLVVDVIGRLVRHQAEAEHARSGVPRHEHLGHGAHPDRVAAEGAEHPHLGPGLVVRAPTA